MEILMGAFGVVWIVITSVKLFTLPARSSLRWYQPMRFIQVITSLDMADFTLSVAVPVALSFVSGGSVFGLAIGAIASFILSVSVHSRLWYLLVPKDVVILAEKHQKWQASLLKSYSGTYTVPWIARVRGVSNGDLV